MRPAVAIPILSLLAVLIGLVGAIRQEASLDEAYVFALSQHGPIAMLAFWTQDPQALVSQVVAYPFAAIDGAAWWLRLPSLLAFGASIAALWWTAIQRYPQGVALGAAALLAISPLAVKNAPDARWPTYAMLLGTIGWGCLLRAIDTGDRRWWVAYSLVAVLCVYTNATLVLLAFAHAVPVLWERRHALRPWLISLAAIAVAGIPLAVLTLGASGVNPLFRVPKPGVADVPGFVAQILGGGGPERVRQALVVLCAALLAAAAWRLRGRLGSAEARQGWLALAWMVIPLAGAFVISQAGDSIWLTRYLIATVPAVCLLIAWSLSHADRRIALPLGAAIVLLMVFAVADGSRSRGEPIGEWAAAVAAARPPGAPVVFYEAEGAQGAGYHEPSLGAADGTPLIPGWDETPPPPEIVLLDNPEFDRLPVGPPTAGLVERLARGSESGVVVLALRPGEPEAPGITWAREHCTVDEQLFEDSPTRVYRVGDCRAEPMPG